MFGNKNHKLSTKLEFFNKIKYQPKVHSCIVGCIILEAYRSPRINHRTPPNDHLPSPIDCQTPPIPTTHRSLSATYRLQPIDHTQPTVAATYRSPAAAYRYLYLYYELCIYKYDNNQKLSEFRSENRQSSLKGGGG